MPEVTALDERVRAALAARPHPAVSAFAAHLAQDRNALGVLFYGSNLRTGSLEGVLDFYILLPASRRSGSGRAFPIMSGITKM